MVFGHRGAIFVLCHKIELREGWHPTPAQQL